MLTGTVRAIYAVSGVNLELWKWPQLPPSVSNLSGAFGICRCLASGGCSEWTAAVRIVGVRVRRECGLMRRGTDGDAATKFESKCTSECSKRGTCNEVRHLRFGFS